MDQKWMFCQVSRIAFLTLEHLPMSSDQYDVAPVSAVGGSLLQKTILCVLSPNYWSRPFSAAPALASPLAAGWGSKQAARKSKKKYMSPYIMDTKTEEILAPMRAAVKEQVRR